MFGGTFDPPHKGHRHLLDAALAQEDFDRVFLIPSYIPPHKDHRPALSFEARKAILLDWFGDVPGLEILALEQERSGRSYTVDTVSTLRERYPDSTLYLLMGTDMFLSFETWNRFADLLRDTVLLVGSREPGDRGKLEEQKRQLESSYTCKGIILCSMEPVVCASSALRAAGGGLAGRALEHIGQALDPNRARHTMQVAEYAQRLAPLCGVDPEKAYLAGLLHDCTKCYPISWQISYAEQEHIDFSADDLASPQVLHQLTGAVFARNALGARDEELLAAICCHTTGKPAMTPLETLLFFADSCEPSRRFPGVEEIRSVGEKDLNRGALLLCDRSIQYLIQKKIHLHPQTVAARNYLLKELEKNG